MLRKYNQGTFVPYYRIKHNYIFCHTWLERYSGIFYFRNTKRRCMAWNYRRQFRGYASDGNICMDCSRDIHCTLQDEFKGCICHAKKDRTRAEMSYFPSGNKPVIGQEILCAGISSACTWGMCV